MIRADVLILGAGPAGATAALNLAPMRRVVLVERQRQSPSRIGEALPPAARRLLNDMGLIDEFIAQGHVPCYGNRSIWRRTAPAETDFLRDLTSVRLNCEQIQLVALDVIVGFVVSSGNRVTKQHFFEERH